MLSIVAGLLIVGAAQLNSWTDPYQNNASHYARDCALVDGALVCAQRAATNASAIRVACVGDSITAVGHTSSVAHHWPDQLQDILDAAHGAGSYSVTNLGVCGSTLQREAHEPWWSTGAYKALVAARWDVVFVMLGTNDAAPTAQGYWPPSNHAHCDAATPATLATCNFASTYADLLAVIATVGPSAATPPETHIMIPPPLMQNGAYGMNQTIINTILPQLVPLIGAANAAGGGGGVNGSAIVTSVIDVYTGMGGVPAPAWIEEMPPKCVLNSTWPPCAWYCDKQSCRPGQCHPNDVGCAKLAQVVYDGWQKTPAYTYSKVVKSDCNGRDIKPQPSCGGNRNLSVAVLEKCCDSTRGCGGFNTHGVIKDRACAAHINPQPTTDLYLINV